MNYIKNNLTTISKAINLKNISIIFYLQHYYFLYYLYNSL